MNFYRFCQIINENMRDYRPEHDIEYPHAWGSKEFKTSLILKDGTLHDAKKNVPLATIPAQIFQSIIGEPNDTYTLEVTVSVSGHYTPGYDHGGGDAENDKVHGEVEIEAENGIIVNDRTKEEAILPDEIARRLFGEGPNFAYQVEYDEVRGGKMHFTVV